MKITATPIKMTPEEALQKARKGGNVFGRALYGSGEITMKLIYLESREVILRLNYQPAPLVKWLGLAERFQRPSQMIRMIVEGTRCTASYSEDPVKTEKVVVAKAESVQDTEFTDEQIFDSAKRAALRMVRRQIGKVAYAELESMRSFYRPYYVAFYGKYEMGTRIRYLPIEADGFRVQKSL